MTEIKGNHYKLAGIGVRQKGTLVETFATFCGVNEDIHQIIAEREEQKANTKPTESQPVKLMPMLRYLTLPDLSVTDILNAVVGVTNLNSQPDRLLSLTDKQGVIDDLGAEKLAQVLVEMGKVRRQYLQDEHYKFVPVAHQPKAGQ